LLECVDLVTPAPNERELLLEMAERLVQDALPARRLGRVRPLRP
jgi:hypothetical protein